MDQISDEQKLEWLTTTKMPRKRAMINNVDYEESWQVPKYRVKRLRRQIRQPSFGSLGKLPLELLFMVFQHLTCQDLEGLHSSSTGGRIAVLAFPRYHTLLTHAPTILAILKVTRLARSFTITKVYDTFTSTLCTTCGQFGGYVFLPAFARCCMRCAEHDPEYMPISRETARKDYGVKGKKILDSLPQCKTIEGYYSSYYGKIQYFTQQLYLLSRGMVGAVGTPNHVRKVPRPVRSYLGENWKKAYQRYMALTPLPSFIPKSASMAEGVYCAGCVVRAREHANVCSNADYCDYQALMPSNPITDGANYFCGNMSGQCPLARERDTLHDSRHILTHLLDCKGAQALLKAEWTESQKEISEGD